MSEQFLAAFFGARPRYGLPGARQMIAEQVEEEDKVAASGDFPPHVRAIPVKVKPVPDWPGEHASISRPVSTTTTAAEMTPANYSDGTE